MAASAAAANAQKVMKGTGSKNRDDTQDIDRITVVPPPIPFVNSAKKDNIPNGVWKPPVVESLNSISLHCLDLSLQHRKSAVILGWLFFALSFIEILSGGLSASVAFANISSTLAGALATITVVVGTLTAAYKFNELAARHRAASMKFMELHDNISLQKIREEGDRFNGPLFAEWAYSVCIKLSSAAPTPWPHLPCYQPKDRDGTAPDVAATAAPATSAAAAKSCPAQDPTTLQQVVVYHTDSNTAASKTVSPSVPSKPDGVAEAQERSLSDKGSDDPLQSTSMLSGYPAFWIPNPLNTLNTSASTSTLNASFQESATQCVSWHPQQFAGTEVRSYEGKP